MKKIVFLIVVCFLAVNLYCQTKTDKKNTIGVHVGFGIGGVQMQPAYTCIGIDYSIRLEHWSLCTGIEHITPYITSIPFQLKRHFGNIAYINFGTGLNVFHFEYNTKVGAGFSFGAGLERKYDNGITFSLNPYAGWKGILRDRYKGSKDTDYVKLGIKLGLGYRF